MTQEIHSSFLARINDLQKEAALIIPAKSGVNFVLAQHIEVLTDITAALATSDLTYDEARGLVPELDKVLTLLKLSPN